MFESIRKHSKIVMILLFLLIIPSFVLFGVDGYRRSMEKGAAVATVGGHDITQGEWDTAHQANVERMRAQMPTLDTRLLDSPDARYATLERLVRERVLLAAAEKARLAPSDARLARTLHDDPGIAAMRSADGKLDMVQYREVLARQGMTPEIYESRVRSELALRQVVDGLAGTAFATPAQAATALNAFFEKRDIQVAMFKPSDFIAKVSVSDADLETYYKANVAQFKVPELADIEYLVLNVDSIKKSIVLSEADLRTYYQQNQAKLAGKEERRASHILITASKDATPAERDKAKNRAEELLAMVRKTPGSFADIARKNSQDPGSAASGGDLDFFARGAMVKPFEDAAFSMKKGEVSDVVASEFGYHIIQLTEIKAPKLRTFDEVRPELEAELRQQQASAKFAETAELFTNGVYEQSDSLKPVADRLKMPILTAINIARTPVVGATGALASARLLDALFSPDAIEKKRNTEAIEIGPSQLAAARMVRYAPASTPPFADIREKVRSLVVATRAVDLARKEGQARLAAFQANPVAASMPAPITVSREQTQQQPQGIVNAALRAPAAKLPAFVGAELDGGFYAVIRINKIESRTSVSDSKSDAAQVAQWWASAEGAAYYNLLKQRMKVDIKAPKPATSVVG